MASEISKEAVEAAEGVWRIGNRHGADADRKREIAEYLDGILRPAPSQSDEALLRDTIAAKDAEIAALREAMMEADGCFEAALAEGWLDAMSNGDIERIRDIWRRRLSWVRARFPAALEMSGGGKTPGPDLAEAMRAELRPLAKQALTEEMDVETKDGADYEYAYNEMVRQVRAALSGSPAPDPAETMRPKEDVRVCVRCSAIAATETRLPNGGERWSCASCGHYWTIRPWSDADE